MATNYQINITLLSDTLVGSGEGFGATIDTDIVFDEVGLPYIPAKRIKGCLRQSAEEVKEMFGQVADLESLLTKLDIDDVFGKTGTQESAPVYFHNLTLPDYEDNYNWLDYFIQHKEYKQLVSPEVILEYFTTLRQQTAIDEEKGVAKEHSLRTSRVLQKGHTFIGELWLARPDDNIVKTLNLACRNLRYIGTKRNRGFGRVKCELLRNSEPIPLEIS